MYLFVPYDSVPVLCIVPYDSVPYSDLYVMATTAVIESWHSAWRPADFTHLEDIFNEYDLKILIY